MNPRLLVSVDQLGDPAWRIFDCRHNLADPGRGEAQYKLGHIPGAQFAHLDRDLSGPKTGRNGRHPLPDPQRFIAWLGEHGVGADTQVVAYDDAGGMMAVRLWWMLRWVGHEAAALLDGGLPAWLASGRALTTDVPSVAPTSYRGSAKQGLLVDAARVEQNLARHDFTLLDARAPLRYSGAEEKLDGKAGHIPGALNRNFQLNVQPDGRFKSPAVLQAEFRALLGTLDPAALVHYCGSGVTAAHNLFAMELAGLHGSRIYPGSWSEWSSDPARPIATGESP